MKLIAMTYNIQSGRNLVRTLDTEFAASVIRGVQPDFVTLNEVRNHTCDVGPVNQADQIARRTGYYPIFGRAIDIDGGEYGNALLTRLPVAESEVIHIPDPDVRDNGYYEHRAILRAVVELGGSRVTVLCTHFGLNASEQELAVRTVLETAAGEKNPVLLMGDLNLTPDAPTLKPLFGFFRDTCAPAPAILTFPSDEPRIKIDYIFHTADIACETVRSIDTQNSDHRPLIAELTIE